jgi:hypothetical protein
MLCEVVPGRIRHPKPPVEHAFHYAEERGFTVEPRRQGHAWGRVHCPIRRQLPASNGSPMTTYTFTLLFTGPDAEAFADQLYDAGHDDALFGFQHGIQFADFDRAAISFQEAVATALRGVESVIPGAEVVRVLPSDLVGVAGIAERVGRSRESIRLLVIGARGPGSFPAPADVVDGHPAYSWPQVVRWFATYDSAAVTAEMVEQADFLAALNAALAERHLDRLQAQVPADEIARARDLVGA